VTTSFAAAFRLAAVGDIAAAVLVPLSGQGKLRVTYNWLYSALNCDPMDDSDFVWLLSKVDEHHISLSPRDAYAGKHLYSSVRDDWDWYVQVQAPYSADWITAVGRNETLLVEGDDLLTVSLRGWNAEYLTVDAGIAAHDDHSGYRLRSVSDGDHKAETFFLGITELLQPGLHLPLRSELSAQQIGAALGPAAEPSLVAYLHRSLRQPPSRSLRCPVNVGPTRCHRNGLRGLLSGAFAGSVYP
jgi:hypothetical protein